ncbi:alpha/beta hydrolase family esterase [Corynebacterium variabile]|uniref:alpha/beta hydrolase family esterase n=1 Tax=Corynebacterium variabile TaxID=1727 RepID=UPI002FE121C2
MQPTRRFSVPGLRNRRLRISGGVLALAVTAGVAVVSSHSAVGEAPEVLDSYRDQRIAESAAITGSENAVVSDARAPIGEGKRLDGPAPGQSTKITLHSGDKDRTAILSVPDDYYPNTPTPVLFAYPGYNQTAEDMQRFASLDNLPAIVVYMQGVGDAWEGAPYAKTSDGEDLRFTTDMLAAVNSTYNVDASRIYATGMSNGGGFAAKLACRAPEIFAATAAVSGAYYPGTGGNCENPSTSFLDIHGVQDETIEYDGGNRHGASYQPARERAEAVAARNNCSPDPVSTALAGDVRRVQWPMCGNGRDVVHLRVGDGGHTWPGDSTGTSGGAERGAASDTAEATSYSLDATTEVWAFVSSHRLAGR